MLPPNGPPLIIDGSETVPETAVTPSANTEVTAKLIEIAEQQTAALLNTRGETSKDAKDAKDAKDTKDVSDPKDTKDVKDVKDVKDTKDVKPVKVDAKVDTKATGIAAGGSVTVGGSTVGGGTTVGGGSTGVTVGGGTTTTPPPTTGPISGVIGKLPKLK